MTIENIDLNSYPGSEKIYRRRNIPYQSGNAPRQPYTDR